MNTNKILVNLKTGALYALLPVMMAACGTKDKGDIDGQLADVNSRISAVEAKLDSMQVNTNERVADSVKRDAPTLEIVANIEKHQKPMAKLKAPKDSVKIKRFTRKISSLKMDSMMRANKVKEAIIQMRMDEFNALYKEQSALIAKRDSLMKIKTR